MRIRGAALCYGAMNRKGAPRGRGSAEILDVDGSGANAEFQSRTFKVARCCGREGAEKKDVELDPLQNRVWPVEVAPRESGTLRNEGMGRRLTKRRGIGFQLRGFREMALTPLQEQPQCLIRRRCRRRRPLRLGPRCNILRRSPRFSETVNNPKLQYWTRPSMRN